MSLSNVEYSSLKRKHTGLHNWGGFSARELTNPEFGNLEVGEPMAPALRHQNSQGTFYALQDFEE